MKNSIKFSLIFILLISVTCLFGQESAGVVVKNIVISTSVEDRQPLGVDTVFAVDTQKLYCYTQLSSDTDSSSIAHVWFFNDKQMAKIELNMRAKTWRTWSSKNIMPAWKGDWRVEVQTSKGDVIAQKFFKIQ